MSIEIGKRFVVLRSAEAHESSARTPVILARGRAFGSGEHETTRSCLEELENIPISPGTRILDLGCGTGILSFAAALMGARSVTALDPDPDSIQATVAGIELNNLEGVILPLRGELESIRGRQYDLIMANLYGDILCSLVADISARLDCGGYLLISGVQFEYAYELKSGFVRAGCMLTKSRYLDEYCTFLFRKQ